MYAPVTFKDSKAEQRIIDSKLKVNQFISANNLRKLENHPYEMYYDASCYYINDKNVIYRISELSGTIYTGPHELHKPLPRFDSMN
jgi:hypothetical protein